MKLTGEQKTEAESILSELIWKTSAKCDLLVDINGELLGIAGYTGNINTVALASLSASHFAATVALARLVSEPQFTVLFHKGDSESIDLNRVGSRYILITIFGSKTILGILREETEATVKKLEVVLKDDGNGAQIPITQVRKTLREEIDTLLKDM